MLKWLLIGCECSASDETSLRLFSAAVESEGWRCWLAWESMRRSVYIFLSRKQYIFMKKFYSLRSSDGSIRLPRICSNKALYPAYFTWCPYVYGQAIGREPSRSSRMWGSVRLWLLYSDQECSPSGSKICWWRTRDESTDTECQRKSVTMCLRLISGMRLYHI